MNSSLARSLVVLSASLLPFASSYASGRIGGFMGGCYNGSGFETGKTCDSVTATSALTLPNGQPLDARVEASGSYSSSDGSRVSIRLNILLIDASDFFNPESGLPVIVRALICKAHRDCAYQVASSPAVLERHAGTREFGFTASYATTNNFGAEYTESLEKVELLVPGVAGVLTIRL